MSPECLPTPVASPSDDERAVDGYTTLAVDVSTMLASTLLRRRNAAILLEALPSAGPVAVRLHGLGAKRAAQRFAIACEFLHKLCARAGVEPATLQVTVDARELAPDMAWHLRAGELGRGRLNVLVDAGSGQSAPAGPPAHELWRTLWRLRSADVVPACWPVVRSPCPLLSREVACDVVPQLALQAPAHSAWSVQLVPLDECLDARQRIDRSALTASLQQAVRSADRRHERLQWANAASRQDAFFNRRIALVIHGIGNIVHRRGLNPCARATLATMTALLHDVRRIVDATSLQLMRRDGLLPAVDASNPCRHPGANLQRRSWHRRWRRATRRTGLRNRNLLVMCPWQLFPSGNSDTRYANLLPLLSFGDACAFEREIGIERWSFAEFHRFYAALRAIAHQNAPSMVVAERL